MSAIEHIRAWFGGRISRKTWWIWFIALFLAGTGIVLAFGLQSFDPNDLQQFRPSLWQTLAAVLLFLPALAITLSGDDGDPDERSELSATHPVRPLPRPGCR